MSKDSLRDIYLELRRVHDLSMKHFSKKTADNQLTVAQFGVVRCMPLGGMITMTDLIRQVGCAPSNMTTIIQRMDRDGVVATTRNPNDQREHLVYLTDKGQEMRLALEPMYQSFLQEAYGHLTEEEADTLLKLLIKLGEHLALM